MEAGLEIGSVLMWKEIAPNFKGIASAGYICSKVRQDADGI